MRTRVIREHYKFWRSLGFPVRRAKRLAAADSRRDRMPVVLQDY